MSEKNETKEEKLNEILEKLKEIDFQGFFDYFASLLVSYGDLAISLGTIQKKHGKTFEVFNEVGDYLPRLMERFVNEAPSDRVASFMKIFMKIIIILPKLDQLMKMSPDEKVTFGNELKNLADDIKKIVEK